MLDWKRWPWSEEPTTTAEPVAGGAPQQMLPRTGQIFAVIFTDGGSLNADWWSEVLDLATGKLKEAYPTALQVGDNIFLVSDFPQKSTGMIKDAVVPLPTAAERVKDGEPMMRAPGIIVIRVDSYAGLASGDIWEWVSHAQKVQE